jgi:hypothetical protein
MSDSLDVFDLRHAVVDPHAQPGSVAYVSIVRNEHGDGRFEITLDYLDPAWDKARETVKFDSDTLAEGHANAEFQLSHSDWRDGLAPAH